MQYYYYASFVKQYKKRPNNDIKKENRYKAKDVNMLTYFVSIVFFMTFTLFLDSIFDNTIYSVIKILVVYYLIHNEYSGSKTFTDYFLTPYFKDGYFYKLALNANEGSTTSVFQTALTSFIDHFKAEYEYVLQEID